MSHTVRTWARPPQIVRRPRRVPRSPLSGATPPNAALVVTGALFGFIFLGLFLLGLTILVGYLWGQFRGFDDSPFASWSRSILRLGWASRARVLSSRYSSRDSGPWTVAGGSFAGMAFPFATFLLCCRKQASAGATEQVPAPAKTGSHTTQC